jgi:hypothetical protein
MRPLSVVQGPVRLSGNVPGGGDSSSARWALPGAHLSQPENKTQHDSQIAEIDSAVRDIAVEVKLRADRLVGELEISQDPALRVGIPLIGQSFSSAEMAGQVVLTAQAMAGVIGSILSGPLWTYASEDMLKSLDETRSLLERLEAQAQPLSVPIAAGHEGLAEQHLLSYVEDLKALRDSAERLLVSTEHAPPVLEPAEKELLDASGLLWALGALSIGGILVFLITSD